MECTECLFATKKINKRRSSPQSKKLKEKKFNNEIEEILGKNNSKIVMYAQKNYVDNTHKSQKNENPDLINSPQRKKLQAAMINYLTIGSFVRPDEAETVSQLRRTKSKDESMRYFIKRHSQNYSLFSALDQRHHSKTMSTSELWDDT